MSSEKAFVNCCAAAAHAAIALAELAPKNVWKFVVKVGVITTTRTPLICNHLLDRKSAGPSNARVHANRQIVKAFPTRPGARNTDDRTEKARRRNGTEVCSSSPAVAATIESLSESVPTSILGMQL